MSEPSVTAVMITRNRPGMVQRAIRCFYSQTYKNKTLFIYDTSDKMTDHPAGIQAVYSSHVSADKRRTIGELRNAANALVTDDIIVHWDDDEWSHPNRIAEQVALLQSSGADCVGYRECLFWRTKMSQSWLYSVPNPAWVIGSSMCYWRRAWRDRVFPSLPDPDRPNSSTEDTVWRRGVKCVGESAVWHVHEVAGATYCEHREPRMICSIHGENTMAYDVENHPDTWYRVPQWDAQCREIMEGARADV